MRTHKHSIPAPHRSQGTTDTERPELLRCPGRCADDPGEPAPEDGLPRSWEARGRAEMRARRWPEAERALRTAAALQPDSAEICLDLGAALAEQGRHREAAVVFGRAAELAPSTARAWMSLGSSLAMLHDLKRAEFCYRRAVEIDPESERARMRLGNVLLLEARLDEARAEFERTRSQVGDAITDLRLAQVLTPVPDSVEQISQERARLAAAIERLDARDVPAGALPAELCATNFHLAYHGLNDRPLQEAWSRALLRIWPALSWNAPHCSAPRSAGRLRVGFISRNLKRHTIARFNEGLLRRLPRDRFEVVAVDLAPSDNPGNLPQCADRVVRCAGSVFDARTAIAAERLDVAFYPDIGTDPVTYLLAHSRLARVQCTTWGHPVTTGIGEMDYFVSSALIEPPDAQAHYSEQLVCLPVLPTCYDAPGEAEPQGVPGFPEDWHVYLCPQSLFKLHPAFDELAGPLLERDRAGRLVLLRDREALERAFLRRFARRYPEAAERVIFLDRMPRAQLLAVMRDAHVMLDTTPFGGGNTSYEALGLGTPIVTMPGEFMRGRVTSGLYRQMEIPGCVASGAEHYVDLAFGLANDPDRRRAAAEEIRAHSHAVYETSTAVLEIAAFLEQAYGRTA